MSAPRIIAVEGGHGSGKSTLARSLADALGAWPHVHRGSTGASPWEAACRYAAQRAYAIRYAEAAGFPLIVSDRGGVSTRILASALDTLGRSDEARALAALHAAERGVIGDPLVTLVCDAPEAVLHARLAERGECWGARETAERAEVLRLARLRGWPVLDTTRPRDVVLAEALACVRGVL